VIPPYPTLPSSRHTSRNGRPPQTHGRPARRLLASKLAPPVRRPGCVARAGLVNRLRVELAARVVSVNAPPGYGKTTLVSDWARRDSRPFGWYSVDETDDAADFLAYLSAAVSRACATSDEGFDPPAPRAPVDDVVTLLAQLLAGADPTVIVLDDVDLLHDPEALRLLALFVDELPNNSQLVLVTWSQPPLSVARLLARGELVEMGVDDLRFTDREAGALFRHAGLDVGESAAEELNDTVEGWAAGLSFAMLSLKAPHTDKSVRLGGDLMFDYFRDALLARLPDDDVRFLTRASVLDRMCGPLCDVVTETDESAERLERLERANLFLVPLDRSRRWYRFHAVFRDILRSELECREPGVAKQLLGRAAGWCASYGDAALALEYAHLADDFSRLIELLERSLPFDPATLPANVDRWLSASNGNGVLEQHPAGATIGALTWGASGRSDAAEIWASVAERASSAPWHALFRSLTCPEGPAQMQADARSAVDTLPADSPWRAAALVAAGSARALQGDGEDADATFALAAETAASLGAPAIESIAVACRSLLAASDGAWLRADALAEAAQKVVSDSRLDDNVVSLFALAASTRSALRHGDWKGVHANLERAATLLPRLSSVMGGFAVFARIEFAHVFLALGDLEGATRLLGDVEEIFSQRPELLVFGDNAAALREQIDARAEYSDGRMATLTAAELRLLPLLTTHLSFREIAARLFVSRNTVKTQAISVYRKLGVSSRGDAIARASGLGLVEADALDR
jgi:LuxR family maltose regulon positive regulatory protein